MVDVRQSIIILKELREHIIPLSEHELWQLEKSLIKEGCHDALTVWVKSPGQIVLVDGHNRYKLCEKNNIPFKIKKLKFSGIEDAKLWMIDNQIGRRNLTGDQISYYRGLKYNSLKKKKGGYEKTQSKGQSETPTSLIVSRTFSISESTIKRDAKFAEGVDIVGRSNPKLKTKILTGEAKVKKSDLQILAQASDPDRLIIKNEADLSNKAKNIRNDILKRVEADLKNFKIPPNNNPEVDKLHAQPVFLNKGDKVRKIKGMILSAINKAINEKDVKAIRELKKLVDRLEMELFE